MNLNLNPRSRDSRRSPFAYLGVPLAGLALFGLAACGTAQTNSANAGSSNDGGKIAGQQAPAGAKARHASGECLAKDVSVRTEAVPSEAGHPFSRLVFENTSGHSCWMRGFPGVSTVAGNDGHQVGHSAIRNSTLASADGGVTTVRLKPGSFAFATLQQTDVGNYSLARCAPRKVRGLRVYVPDETAAKYVPAPGDACSDGSVGRPQIGPITSNPRS